jgi:hypothetical protein
MLHACRARWEYDQPSNLLSPHPHFVVHTLTPTHRLTVRVRSNSSHTTPCVWKRGSRVGAKNPRRKSRPRLLRSCSAQVVCVCEKPALTHHVIAFFSPCDPLAHITACVRVAPHSTTMNAYQKSSTACRLHTAAVAGLGTPHHRTGHNSTHLPRCTTQSSQPYRQPSNSRQKCCKDNIKVCNSKGSSHAFSLSLPTDCWH